MILSSTLDAFGRRRLHFPEMMLKLITSSVSDALATLLQDQRSLYRNRRWYHR